MLKKLSLNDLAIISKLKLNKDNKIYDKNCKMYFDNELLRQKFLNRIDRAEKNILENKVMTSEEVDNYFSKKYEI